MASQGHTCTLHLDLVSQPFQRMQQLMAFTVSRSSTGAALRSLARLAYCVRATPGQRSVVAQATSSPSLSTAMSDPCSLSNPTSARVKHSAFELDVNFETKAIEGWAQLDVVVLEDSASRLALDTSGLKVHSVQLVGSAQALDFAFGEQHKALGIPLNISLPPGLSAGQNVQVGIRFTAPSTSSAVQWLDPAQTAGGKEPYLFTQCQAIHARALIPCQDSPGAKMSYTAAVRVPAQLTALMSAVEAAPGEPGVDQGVPHLVDVQPAYPTKVFYFKQQVPIPPYLFALAVGDLTSRDLGDRTRVWSEPSMVDSGAYEFAETAKFLEAGEAIAGEYVWKRYDLLLLPPSFPYGGMENPCLTFVTPTLLAGDRSLTNVVAHEIAHSWTGNLVTNASWEHFWCNEGFTVFLERKILGRLYGDKTFQFHAANGGISLAEEIKRFGPDNPYTRLVPDLTGGVDPDEVFSKVPYEKGFAFLYYLQTLVGGADRFDPFLKAYLSHFQYTTVTSDQFKSFFLDYFKDVAEVQQVDWQTWFYAPGMPPVTNQYDTSLADAAYNLAKRWHTADVMGIGSAGPEGASPADVEGWSSDQMVAFLDKLGEYRAAQPMHASMTSKMAHMYGLYKVKNAEIRSSFYKLAISAEDAEVLPSVVDLLSSQGRMKFLRPLYRALFKSKMGKQLALDTFAAHQASYHPIAQKMVAADLGLA